MLRALPLLALFVLLASGASAAENPRVTLLTTHGEIVVELHAGEAPQSTANFLEYVRAGFYDGTVFHRVIPGFMIQGGGYTSDMARKETRAPIRNEAGNGLANTRGTLAMARTSDPHSATAQFFINVADNAFLDHSGPTPRGWGYAVFGRVVDGLEIVDTIAASPTGRAAGMADVPLEAIVIERAYQSGDAGGAP